MNPSRHHIIPSPLGPLTLVADDADHLCGLYLPDHRGGALLSGGDRPATDPSTFSEPVGGVLEHATEQLNEYFAGARTVFDLPLATSGNDLQQRVWAALRRIPYAATTTYGQIAAELGLGPGASRAVGSANARNPISIIVPCHRVIGASGSLTGYAGGLSAKRHLLDLEAASAGATLFA